MDNYIFDLDENITRTAVSYTNRYDIRISADLYTHMDLDASEEHRALIIGAPYGGVKEQSPGLYAQILAQRGFAVLTFDPSYNGYSGGEPRHLSSPEIFVEDFSAAVDYLGTREYVNRESIGAIGICGSGGFALSAAQVDPRIRAIATVSMYDISRMQLESITGSEEDRTQALESIAEQRYIDFEAEAPVLTGRGAAIGFDENTDPVAREFGEFYSTPRGYHHNALSQFTATSTPAFVNFPLLEHIEWISPRPILFIAGTEAHSLYFSEDAYASAAQPKELLTVSGASHVDLYDKTELIPFDKIVEFFTTNL
ncbi:alpha/beta hydrolase [Corynebacterium glyciniphilum]|uniref:alpha/beta hydrolase n=1 Tax=Corynebacterium glyciniphilum TaxID=1404244 RepID=UPI003DA141F5